MATLRQNQVLELERHFFDASQACAERGLWQSAKWAAELYRSLPDVGDDTTSGNSASTLSPRHERPSKDYVVAKSYFDCREYDRCAEIFLPRVMTNLPIVPRLPLDNDVESIKKGKNPLAGLAKKKTSIPSLAKTDSKGFFLALYAKFLAGEKRRDEESEMVMGPTDGGMIVNKEINAIAAILDQWFSELDGTDQNGGGWLEYLYGIMLVKSENERHAKEWLISSVGIYPFNWGAWQELSNLIGAVEELDAVIQQVPQTIMSFMFHIYTSQELAQATEQVFTALAQLQVIFPKSDFLKTQRALLLYHSKEFEESDSEFSAILKNDPRRLDSMDHYSNILYVLEARPKLAHLAQLATNTDRFRPETCCIVGNYYSMNSEHEKAVMYFRRALTLDRSFLSAWTLMGHEYVEMKNTHAAIESYRRAVDVNRKDYRAWYGMGQTYEMLEMHSYAIFYFQRAASLRPFDAKIWTALGASFARTGRLANAIRAYKRALVAGSYLDAGNSFGQEGAIIQGLGGGILDPESLYQIASLYERMQDQEECAAYMELVLAQEDGSSLLVEDVEEDYHDVGTRRNEVAGMGVTATTSKARMWLARYEFSRHDYPRAMELCNELCQDGVEVEDAKALIRDIRARVDMERDRERAN